MVSFYQYTPEDIMIDWRLVSGKLGGMGITDRAVWRGNL